MPGYVSHTIMARDIYQKIGNDKVNLDYMLTYSLGGDLTKYSKCRRVSHKVSKDEFIFNMCDYIKNNNMVDNKDAMGVLYGHICHVIMDDIMHPLIRKVSKLCVRNKHNHTLIEGYMDSYLVKYKYNKSVDRYDNNALFKGKINKDIKDMLDYTYYKTYGCKHISRYYKFNIFLYKKIKYLYKILGIDMLKKLSGFNKFRDNNKNIDIFNFNHEIEYKNIFLEKESEDFITLYDDCINNACLYIENVNKYINKST